MKYIVISGDILNSKKNIFNAKNNVSQTIISRLEKFNQKFKDILIYPVAVFKGDEIQCVLTFDNVDYICKIIRELYYCFYPFKLRIGIGIGNAENNPLSGKDINSSLSATGEAFFLAREAVEITKLKNKGKLHYCIYFIGGKNKEVERFLNLLFVYEEKIIGKWKKETYEIIFLLEENKSHKEIAQHFYINNKVGKIENSLRSNITYKIKYSDYYILKETEDSIIEIIKNNNKGD